MNDDAHEARETPFAPCMAEADPNIPPEARSRFRETEYFRTPSGKVIPIETYTLVDQANVRQTVTFKV